MLVPFHIGSLPKTPWKNGEGVTREISMGPEDADVGTFDWRLTLADIDPGPFSFSHFAGVDRTMVVSGPGMEMARHGIAMSGMAPVEPFSLLQMAGEDPIDARLKGAPIQALNLMTRRGRAGGSIAVHRQSGPIALDGDINVLLCMQDSVALAFEDSEDSEDKGSIFLGRGQVLVVRPNAPTRCLSTGRSPDAILLAAIVRLKRSRK